MANYKKYDEAVKLYTDLIKKFPKGSIFYGGRGTYYLKSKIYKNAIADFSKAIDLSTRSEYSYHSSRGDAYWAMGNFNAALSDFVFLCNEGLSYGCDNARAVRADISRGPNWINAATTDNINYYYDKSALAKNKNGTITLWVKGEITNKDDFITAQGLINEKDKYENVSQTLTQHSFNCSEKLIKSLNYLVYSENGQIIYSFASEDAKFESVIPDSIGAAFLDKACKPTEPKKASKK